MPKGKHLDGFGTIVDRIVKIVMDAVEIDSAGLNGIRRVGHFPNSWLPSNEVEGTLEVIGQCVHGTTSVAVPPSTA